MTRDEIRSILRGVGACGESDGKNACLLPPGHDGPHGFELVPTKVSADDLSDEERVKLIARTIG